MARPYSIVIIGATGVTGNKCCEYFAENYGFDMNIKWAIAGRTKSKLKKVLIDLNELFPEIINKPDIIIADSSNEESLEAMVRKTKVIISTVGPFALYGEPLVRVCVRYNTHYIDSTAESHFIKAIADNYHRQAQNNQTFIIPSCGYDSVPSDMGAFLLAYHFNNKYGEKTASVHLALEELSGGISGGTIASFIELIDSIIKDTWAMLNTNLLLDTGVRPTNKTGITFLKYSQVLKKYQTFYYMEFTNVRYVLRSNSLLKNGYGPDFQYSEGMSAKGLFSAIVSLVMILLFVLLLAIPFTRRWIQKMKPPGDGPTREQVKKGFFKFRAVGISSGDRKAIATIVGVSDPGYGETCKMLVESALCIALEKDRLPRDVSNGLYKSLNGGVVTAASALGFVLIERLRNAKMKFDVKDLE